MRYSNYYDQVLDSELRLLAKSYLGKSYSSKTIPNYKCKYCKSKVFFFQSASGGKVLFDALGDPWPKHNCLGIEYAQRKSSLKISPNEWRQMSGLCATPSPHENRSIFSGVIGNDFSQSQNRIELEIFVEDPILIKDVYINSGTEQSAGNEIEALVILDDGRHQFHNSKMLNIESFEMEDLSGKKPYKIQYPLL